MEKTVSTRKSAREQKRCLYNNYGYLKKSTKFVGTVLVTGTMVAPFLTISDVNTADAEEKVPEPVTNEQAAEKKEPTSSAETPQALSATTITEEKEQETAQAPPAQASPQEQTYVVQTGDSVWSIAENFGIAETDFVARNAIKDDLIYAGQTVIVGENKPTAPVEQAPATETTAEKPEAPTAPATPEVLQPVAVSTNEQPSKEKITDGSQKEQPIVPTETAEQPSQVVQEAPETATTANDQPTQEQQTPAPVNDRGEAIVNEAKKYLGIAYKWGGKDPSGFDCSGLTRYVYLQVTGKNIGEYTVPQESSGSRIDDVSQAQAGDLLFWGTAGATEHVAIALGNGQYIHAPKPKENVQYGSIKWYRPDFAVHVY